jgi:hypothetical protein
MAVLDYCDGIRFKPGLDTGANRDYNRSDAGKNRIESG